MIKREEKRLDWDKHDSCNAKEQIFITGKKKHVIWDTTYQQLNMNSKSDLLHNGNNGSNWTLVDKHLITIRKEMLALLDAQKSKNNDAP